MALSQLTRTSLRISLQHPVHPSTSAHFYYYYLPRVPRQCLTTAISTSLPLFVSWPCSCDLTRRNAWVAGNCTECPRIFLTHSHNTLASWNSDRIVCSWSPGEKGTPFFFSLSLPTCAKRQDWPASIHPSPTCSVWKIHYLVVRLLDWSVLSLHPPCVYQQPWLGAINRVQLILSSRVQAKGSHPRTNVPFHPSLRWPRKIENIQSGWQYFFRELKFNFLISDSVSTAKIKMINFQHQFSSLFMRDICVCRQRKWTNKTVIVKCCLFWDWSQKTRSSEVFTHLRGRRVSRWWWLVHKAKYYLLFRNPA